MKGDVVNGLGFLAILPWYYYLAFSSYFDDINDEAISSTERQYSALYDIPDSFEASEQSVTHLLHKYGTASLRQQFSVCLAFSLTVGCCYLSWMKLNSRVISAVAFVASVISTSLMNIYQWPHPGEQIIIPQSLWHLLILAANTELHLADEIVLSIVALLGFMITAYITPIYTIKDTMPTLAAATAFHIAFQVSRAVDRNRIFSLKNDTFRGIVATVTLSTVFAYHVLGEVINMMSQPGYASTGGFSILRAGFFASFGLLAAGAFKTESDANEVLEKLVQERTKQILIQAHRLRMVEMALEASETAIAITDKDLRIKWFNPAFKRLTGRKDSDLNEQLILESLTTSVSDKSKIMESFFKNASTEEEIVINMATFQIQVGPFMDEKSMYSETSLVDTKNCYLVTLKDLTEKRRREKAEEAAAREIVLKQAMSESCQILSHELRTPLQGIIGVTSMMLDGQKLDKEVEESLSLIMISSRLLLTLINNILDVRKCDANMMTEFELVSTELFQPMQDAVNFCRPLGAVLNVTIELVPTNLNKIVVASDALRLQQVLINLISNSIKHSTTGCVITVRSKISTLAEAEKLIKDSLQSGPHQDSWDSEFKQHKDKMKVVIISVSDTGGGIDINQADRLFRKFSQLNDHCTIKLGGNNLPGQPTGTGLGLNLCLKFVQRMKGNIWAANNPNGIGACFSFYLPLLYEEDHRNVLPQAVVVTDIQHHSSESSLVSVTAQARRVLIVDDTLINLKVLQRMLKQIGIESVVCVDSGHKALQMLETTKFDIVITDIQMPGMSGIELAETIFQKYDQSTKPLVVGLTADTSKEMDERCIRSGMKMALHKPLTANQLKELFEKAEMYYL